ncbi:hypothetical protein ACE3MZ_12865 [Paenibacillus sp. WLX1005]|uniref:hypothetical protein n=1 Tax=Paenibacillus sp. WLX1005 TaxID=3243766 RepID=UPI003983F020
MSRLIEMEIDKTIADEQEVQEMEKRLNAEHGFQSVQDLLIFLKEHWNGIPEEEPITITGEKRHVGDVDLEDVTELYKDSFKWNV